jgi:hypothetical protein
MFDLFVEVVFMSLVAGRENLNEREKSIAFEIMEHPNRYLTHSLATHNKLCSENERCILCLLDSQLLS